MAAIARRRWNSFARRNENIAASIESRVEDLARGLAKNFTGGGWSMVGPLISDYRWLAQQIAPLLDATSESDKKSVAASVRQVVIEKIVASRDGGILITPSLPPDTDYAFIYRDASSVRWDAASRSLLVLDIDGFDAVDYVRHVIAAVKNEYGDDLIMTPRTVLSGLPESAQKQMLREFGRGEDGEPIHRN